ncbi:MAG: DMT family transporter [Gemmatimonadaceae bacterium]
MRRSAAAATLLVALSACCFGSITILVTIAQRAGAPLLTILVWRYLLGAATLALLSGGVAALASARGKRLRLVALGGGGQAVIGFTSLLALRWIPVATLVFLFYTYPSWIAVFAVLRHSERLDGPKVAALALSLAGIALMVGAPRAQGLHPIGVALALGSAVIYALYVPFIGALSEGVTARVASAHVAAGAGLCFLLVGACVAALGAAAPTMISAATRETMTVTAQMTPAAWAATATLAVVSTALAFILFLNGLAGIGPVRTGIISTIEPFWASLLGAVVLRQRLGVETLLGGAAIAAAVMLLQFRQARPVTVGGVDQSIS